MKYEREYGVDALRIISMWMVVILHVLGQGGILDSLERASNQYMIAWLLEIVAYSAVNCYGLISGYVGVNSRTKRSSTLNLWIQVVFYSTVLSFIAHFIWPESVHSKEWINGFFPLNSRYYWYYTAYFFVSLLMPYLNIALRSIDKKEALVGLATVIAMLTLNETVFRNDMFTVCGGYTAIWLLVLYLMGGFIRLYGEELISYQWIKEYSGFLFLLGVGITWSVKNYVDPNGIPLVLGREIVAEALISYVSPAIILSSVALFAAFSSWRPSGQMCRWISLVSPAAFGVYLIHVHPQIWQYYMKDAYKSFGNLNAYLLPFAVLGTATVVFIVCVVIDLLRGKVFEILKVKESCQALMEKIGLS